MCRLRFILQDSRNSKPLGNFFLDFNPYLKRPEQLLELEKVLQIESIN
jgi:hypothetical protein